VRALKSCGSRKAAIRLAAAWLLVWVLVMALIFSTVAASMPPAARAAKWQVTSRRD
jgi:ABC-type lipoprotein release transport system permease subunit